ncbi:MAG: nucleoside phosphorylase [Anaerolineaceae bacterium]|nr:nucleoside phosphorylase [Anaerolineaceae bacterium]
MTSTLYLQASAGDIGEAVLLSGDPARVQSISAQLENPVPIAANREYHSATGSFRGRRISAVSAGIGAPSTAIAIEELARLGVRAIVRMGTMMGVTVPMGSYVIAQAAARCEGTSAAYLPLPYPAVADFALMRALHDTGTAQGLDVRLGTTVTKDAFYPGMAPSLADRGELDIDEMERAGIVALDMETSLLYILARQLGMAAAAMCYVTNSARPFGMLGSEQRASGEQGLIRCVLNALVTWLEEQDGE